MDQKNLIQKVPLWQAMKNPSENNRIFLLLPDILYKFIFSKGNSKSIAKIDADTLELLCREADDNLLGSLLYYYCGKDQVLPGSWQDKWSADFRAESANELRRTHELTNIFKILADNDIEAAPLKGACLAYDYYPHPALRGMGDFDILIKPESIKKAFKLMIDNNFTSDHDRHKHHEPQLSSPRGFVVELHTHITPNSKRCEYEDLWQNCQKSEFNGQTVTSLSPEINLLHTIDHAFRDRLNGGLKAFIDAAYILANAAIDTRKLENCAKKIGFYDEFSLFMNIFPEFFPEKYIPASEQVSSELLESARYLVYNFKIIRSLDGYQIMLHRDYNKLSLTGKLLFIIHKMNVTPSAVAKMYDCRIYSPMLIFYYFHRAYKYFIKLVLFKKKSKQSSLPERIGIYQKRIHYLAIQNKN
ncbi:MAG: nucleotidyltransferase family protein [Victivallaceae bacterium]|nr:nucleotidyltransferase family protein [Victivallaceae bacterium]